MVFLRGSQEVISERLGRRVGHFMPTNLLRSQFNTLEVPQPDENVVEVDISQPLNAIVLEIVRFSLSNERS